MSRRETEIRGMLTIKKLCVVVKKSLNRKVVEGCPVGGNI